MDRCPSRTGGTGPLAWSVTTGPDGGYRFGDLLEGTYQVSVTADGYLPATGTVTVTAGTPATLDFSLQPTDVGVLGDVDGALTAYLCGEGVPTTELEWSNGLELDRFEVLVVNGGSPDAATFRAVLAAADAAGCRSCSPAPGAWTGAGSGRWSATPTGSGSARRGTATGRSG